jgi:hypothetical protein
MAIIAMNGATLEEPISPPVKSPDMPWLEEGVGTTFSFGTSASRSSTGWLKICHSDNRCFEELTKWFFEGDPRRRVK